VVIRVLAAVIQKADRYLVCLRPRHKRHGGLWEFPGGKLESGENLLEAARRELREELGVEVIGVGDPIFSSRDQDSSFLIEFTLVAIAGTPKAREHDEVRWATPEETRSLNLAPADRAFASHYFRDNYQAP
jgi:8-oxo-dGTP pyrophosphatase MutT (NUDIX family)